MIVSIKFIKYKKFSNILFFFLNLSTSLIEVGILFFPFSFFIFGNQWVFKKKYFVHTVAICEWDKIGGYTLHPRGGGLH